jgi:chromosome segregation ATPase
MSTLEAQIKIVNEKLQQLLKKNALLQKQNEMLHAEVNSFKQKEEDYKASIDSISQKVNILQAARGNMSKEDQKKLESRIDKYIKEIDRCITILSE